jgi:MFS family permease
MAEGRGKKCLEAVRQATVEPLLFIYMFGAVLSDPTQQALIYRKVCIRHLNAMTPAAINATSWLMNSIGSTNTSSNSVGSTFGVSNDDICDNLKNESYRDLETAVQADASHWFLYAALCFEIPSVLVAFFYGSLSDHFSRKLSLIVPIIGQSIAVSNWIANSFYPAAPMGYLLIGPLISGCFGGWVTLLVGSMSYLSDISTDAERTSRIAIAEACIAFPIAMSFFVSGVYLEATSFAVVLSTTLALYLVCIGYACVRIREPPGRVREGATWGGVWRKVFGPSAVAAALKGVFRQRTLNRRRQLIVLFASLVIGMISNERKYTGVNINVLNHLSIGQV